jgi:hypothetical protein
VGVQKAALWLLALLIAVGFATACDGGDGDDVQRLSAAEYNSQFDIAQEEQEQIARDRLAALPPVEIRSSDGLDEGERAYLRQFAQVRAANARDMGRALSVLVPPEELQQAHEHYLDALARRLEMLADAIERASDAPTAGAVFEGQQEINRQVLEKCAALNEAIVAAGVRPPLANCSLEETPPAR